MSEQTIPVLAEHQAPEITTNPGGYTPSPEEKQALKLVNKLFDKAKQHRKKYDEKWLDNYKMFRGKQWKEQRPTYRHSEVINFIFQDIQSTVPMLTDSRPRIEYLPQEPQDMEFAKILTDVAASDWDSNNWLMKLASNLYDSAIYGTAIGGMGFDPEAKMGMGGIEYTDDDPIYCFPDPNAQDINDKRGRFFIYAEPVDVAVLKRDYPEHKDHFKPDLIDLIQGDKTNLDQVRYKSPVDNKTVIEGTSSYEASYKDQCLKVTCWLKSDEFIEEQKDKTLEDGTTQPYFEQRLKYPNGRKIVIAGGVVCEDGPNEFDDGLFPKARLVNYILPREFWGMSDVEQLEGPQKIFNKLVSFALDVLTLMGNPIWKVPTGAGIDTDNLFNRPGLIVEYDGAQPPTREEGVQLQPYVLQLIDRMRDWFQDISGRTDVSQGQNPSGVTAASAITALQEAAQTRIRQKSRNVDAFLQNLGTLYKNRVFQFYSAPRIVRLTADNNAQQYFKLHVESIQNPDGSVGRKATVRPYIQDPTTGAYSEAVNAKEYMLKADFDVKVITGSTLPFAKKEKAAVAKEGVELGALDELEWLKAVEWPNAEEVYQRVQERKAQQAQAHAQASTPPAPAGAPPPPAA